MSKIFLNSIAGAMQGNIPVYNMDIKYTGYHNGQWGGEVSSSATVPIIYKGSTNRIRGCDTSNSYSHAGSGNIGHTDYQQLMAELHSVGGFTLTAEFAQQRSTNIIWQLPTTKGYLTYIRVFDSKNNRLTYNLVASDFKDIATLADCVIKDGVGFEYARILNGSSLNADKTSTYFFFQENFELQQKSILRFGYIYDFSFNELSYNDWLIAMPFDQNINDLYIGTTQPIEFDDDFGEYSGGGGYGGGSFDDSSDHMGLPSLPDIGVSDSGIVNVYLISKNQLQGFVDDLFPDFELPTPSTAEGIEAVAENLSNTVKVIGDFANSYINRGLVDYVIDCHIVPVVPAAVDNIGLKVGFKVFSYNPKKVTSDYVEFDCGSLSIPEYFQNFLDYAGTRAKLYLPFIGFVDVKPEWFQSGKLQIIYHFNIIDGSCIANVIGTSSKSKLSDTVVATFGGNCCVHMPITGINYSSMISGIAGGVGQVASGIASGNMATALKGLENAVSARPEMQQSNGYNAGMSFMSYRQPYLLIERAVASFSKNYPKEKGLPLNATQKLANLSGMTICENVVLDNFPCLPEEKEMIQAALAEGIIL